MTTDECLDLVSQLARAGVREISLIGGEAYLRRDWLEIIREISKNNIYCSLQTGGRALSKEKIESAVEAGLSSIGVSVDGLEETHNKLRGIGSSYSQAIEVIRTANTLGLNPTVNTQINKENMHELADLMNVIIGEGVKVWQVQLTVAMGNAADNDYLIIQPFEITAIHETLYELYSIAHKNGLRIDPGNNIGYFGPFEYKWRAINNDASHWKGCEAGSTTLGIESDGTIKGCPSLPSHPYSGGNIRNLELHEILDSGSEMPNQQNRTSDDLWGYCKTCYYSEICRAGCSWTTHVLFGNDGNNPYCVYRASKLEKSGLREEVVKVADAPGNPFDSGLFELHVKDNLDQIVDHSDPRYADSTKRQIDSTSETLSLCSGCLQYFYDDETHCSHCGRMQRNTRRQSKKEEIRILVGEVRSQVSDLERRASDIETMIDGFRMK